MTEQNRIQWVYSSRDNQELTERYDQWAGDYDADLEGDFEYRGPRLAAEILARYVPRESSILDAGAGTGLVGVALSQMGFGTLDAMDMSRGMLEEARKKNVYREFYQRVLGEPLGFATGDYDAVICVGTFTVGHAPASSLDELVRVTRPGGHIVFTLRPDVYEENGFREKQTALESAGKWQLVEATEPLHLLQKGEPHISHQVWAYQVR